MKKIFLLTCVWISLSSAAQSREEKVILFNVRALHNAVFVKKDSVALQRLFASGLTYGHSSGKIETRAEAIHNISHNQSVYGDLALSAVNVRVEGTTAVSRHTMTAVETNAEGKTNPLKLHILLVWTKQKKAWKLIARQAVRLT